MMCNDKTVTMKMSAPIATPDGPYDLSFCVSIRNGATGAMIAETVAHWLHAAAMIGRGEVECSEEFTERSEYEVSEHETNRVTIYGDMRVFTSSGLRMLQVNIFCETTSAKDFVDFTWGIMEGMGRIAKLPNVIKFPNVIKPQKQQGELDKHFGKRETQKQEAPPQQGAAHQPKDPVATRPVFDFLPQDAKLEAERNFAGQVVGLQLGAVSREEITYDDGGTEDRVLFWPPNGEYPYSKKIKVKVDSGDTNYSLKALNRTPIMQRLPEVNYKVPIGGVAYFKLNKGKGDYADKVYWNFVNYTEGAAPPAPEQVEPLARSIDDIPF